MTKDATDVQAKRNKQILLRKLKRLAAESHRRWNNPKAESLEVRCYCGKEQGLIEAIEQVEKSDDK